MIRPRRFWSLIRSRRVMAKLPTQPVGRRCRRRGPIAAVGVADDRLGDAPARSSGRTARRCRRGSGGRTGRRRRPSTRSPTSSTSSRSRSASPGHAEAGEHLLAEAVGGGDGGGVEVRQGALQVGPACGDLVGRAPAEVRPARDRSESGASGASARAASVRRSQTRSRSVPVALRVNVTTSSSSSGRPSATSATTRDATAWVLPVPALASSTVMPSGTGAVGVELVGRVAVTSDRPALRRGSGPTAGGRAGRTGRRRRRSSRLALTAEHEEVLGVLVLLRASRSRSSTPTRPSPSGSPRPPRDARRRSGRTSRSRAAAARAAPRRAGRRDRSGRATAASWASGGQARTSRRRRPSRPTVDGGERPVGVRGGGGEEVDPRPQHRLRAELRERRRPDRRADDVGHRADDAGGRRASATSTSSELRGPSATSRAAVGDRLGARRGPWPARRDRARRAAAGRAPARRRTRRRGRRRRAAR